MTTCKRFVLCSLLTICYGVGAVACLEYQRALVQRLTHPAVSGSSVRHQFSVFAVARCKLLRPVDVHHRPEWPANLLLGCPDYRRRSRLSTSAPLNIRAGDVVSRLDGTSVMNNAYQGPNGWVMPEMDRHFGSTELRYISHGTKTMLTWALST